MTSQRFGVNLEPAVWRLVSAGTAAVASTGVEVGKGATIRIACQGAGLWIITGASGDTATAGTANEILIPSGGVEFMRTGGDDYVHLIQEAATAKWSVSVVGDDF